MVEYNTVTDLPIMDEATENTHVIVEDNGNFKRMSGDKLGGGGVKTAIIKPTWWEECIESMLTGGAQEANAEESEWACINMTFDEAYNTLAAGEPLEALVAGMDGPGWYRTPINFLGISLDGTHRSVSIGYEGDLYWTEEYGITDGNPYGTPS